MPFLDLDDIAVDSYKYAREALWDNPVRWLILTILSWIPIVNFIALGYQMRVLQGNTTPPELDNYWDLFVDGLKYFVASLLYAIVFIIIIGVVFLAFGLLMVGGAGAVGLIGSSSPRGAGGILGGVIAIMGMGVFYILGIAAVVVLIYIGLMYFMAMVRFARSGNIGDALDFSGNMAHIRRIGWLNYYAALMVLSVLITLLIYFAVGVGFLTVFIGFVLILPLLPALAVFTSRYMSRVYDSASALA